MKTTKIYSILFAFIIIGTGLGTAINSIEAHINPFVAGATVDMEQLKKFKNYIDWAKEYPKDSQPENQNTNAKVKTAKKSLFALVKKIISSVDANAKNFIPCRMTLIEIGHYINKVMGGNMFLNLDWLVRFGNGYYGYVIAEKDDYSPDARRFAEFANYVKSLGIKFAYVLCPSKMSMLSKDLPSGVKDYTNENADTFLKVFDKEKVTYLDLRQEMKNDFQDYYSCFFKADHHWLPETGFWATQKIVSFLNNSIMMGMDETIVKDSNFNRKVYPKIFLGSQGKKVTLSMAEPEDITVITPKFESDFSFESYCNDIVRNGPFEDSILVQSFLNVDYYAISNYSVYLGTTGSVARIINKRLSNGPKIVMLRDSYAVVVAPFLAFLARELVIVDVRVRQGNYFNGSIKKFVKKENPDLVIACYSCSGFNPKESDRASISNFY